MSTVTLSGSDVSATRNLFDKTATTNTTNSDLDSVTVLHSAPRAMPARNDGIPLGVYVTKNHPWAVIGPKKRDEGSGSVPRKWNRSQSLGPISALKALSHSKTTNDLRIPAGKAHIALPGSPATQFSITPSPRSETLSQEDNAFDVFSPQVGSSSSSSSSFSLKRPRRHSECSASSMTFRAPSEAGSRAGSQSDDLSPFTTRSSSISSASSIAYRAPSEAASPLCPSEKGSPALSGIKAPSESSSPRIPALSSSPQFALTPMGLPPSVFSQSDNPGLGTLFFIEVERVEAAEED